MPTRRDFIRTAGLSSAALGGGTWAWGQPPSPLYQGTQLSIPEPRERGYYRPLDELSVICTPQAHRYECRDGQGRLYAEGAAQAEVQIELAGALGYHELYLLDRKGRELDRVSFKVDCETFLKDGGGRYADFFDILRETLFSSTYSSGKLVRYNGKYYRYYSSWFQDHVFAAEGLKYFLPDLKTGIELYADAQREDGLIWDNYKHPYPEVQSYWEYRFDYGGFTYRPEDPRSSAIFVRIPVENIGEHTFLEGLYYAWRATGDDAWMRQYLDHALKAVRFATSSPWYWNPDTQLLKRPFSIDRWDFQSDLDARITSKDFMGADLDRTRYGVMYGDNICLANGCQWLAEMLEVAGRTEEAEEMEALAAGLWTRLDALAWDGDFYRHWVPVENKQELDFGVDTNRQITLSNAMALLRGLPHDKAVRIIQTYRDLRDKLPTRTPGEWYLCYPPFERGWHVGKWEYMNGGVSPIVAGDLALG
ncbi:MAG: twin-arginine translocation signal domain-containing protein, partial [Bacteroidetes bacterium]